MRADFNPNQNGYKDLGSFKFWCQKVLPTVYDDSLSYYELLNKVVNYLNDVINNSNLMGENIVSLHEAYINLQGYVNHYFDNLNVQNEINKKLDNMASDGSLSVLIQPMFDEYKEEIGCILDAQDTILSDMNETLAANSEEISVLTARMNVLSTLKDGSTTGDAELADARIDYKGKIYDNAGSAIRGQVSDLKEDVSIKLELKNGFYIGYTNGTIRTYSELKYVEMPVAEGMNIKYSYVNAADERGLAFYDADGVFISGYQTLTTPQDITVPKNAVLLRATVNSVSDIKLNHYNNVMSRISEKVSTLSEIHIDPVQIEFVNGKYASYWNGNCPAEPSYKYVKFCVVGGSTIVYSFKHTPDDSGLHFLDESGAYISGVQATSEEQIIPVPENAVICAATVKTPSDVKFVTHSTIAPILREVRKTQENNIETLVSAVALQIEFVTGKYARYSNANCPSESGYNYVKFYVAGGSTIVYSFKHNPDNSGLHFLDENGAYISGVQATNEEQIVQVPENAVVCTATVKNPSDVKIDIFTTITPLVKASAKNRVDGLHCTEYPIETLTHETGFLDIFLNVGCIGDSLASGEVWWNEGGEPHGADLYEYSWGQFLARKTGNKYYNWSRGGATTKSWLASSYATECFDGNHLCQAYIIGLGQNDYNERMTIGTSADIDMSNYNNNADSFYGNYGKIIQKIKEVNHKAKIFVITDMNTSVDAGGYNTPVRDMATLFDNVYVIDLNQYGTKYYKLDILNAQMRGGHYNAMGYKICSMLIANYIDWLVKKHYTEFTQVELIGTNHSWN